MPDMTVTPLHPSLGAEVSGIDLSRDIDGDTRAALSRALAEHLALVFRGQSLAPEQYLAAADAFGPPMRQHYSQHHMPGYPDIGLVWHRNGQRPAERWHTDHTNRERPPAATILYGVEIPPAGGGTSVANMRAAYSRTRYGRSPRSRSACSRAWPARSIRNRKFWCRADEPYRSPLEVTPAFAGFPEWLTAGFARALPLRTGLCRKM